MIVVMSAAVAVAVVDGDDGMREKKWSIGSDRIQMIGMRSEKYVRKHIQTK